MLQNLVDDLGRDLANVLPRRVADDLRRDRRLVGIVNAGEAVNRAFARLLVQVLGVAQLANLQRRVHEHLHKVADGVPRFFAGRAVGRDSRDQHHDSVAGEHPGHKRDAANVLVAVRLAEAEILTKVLADDVAIDDLDLQSMREQLGGDGATDGRLAGAAQPSEPYGHAMLLRNTRARIGIASLACPRLSHCGDHARGHGVVVARIHDDEAAGHAIVFINIAEDGAVQFELDFSDFVEAQAVAFDLGKGVDVDLLVQLDDASTNGLRGVLDEVTRVIPQRCGRKPDEIAGDSGRYLRWIFRRHQHVAAAQVDVLRQRQDDRLRSHSLLQILRLQQNSIDRRTLSRRQRQHFVAYLHRAGAYLAGVTAEILIGTNDGLHRKAEAVAHRRRGRKSFEQLQQRWSGIPRHRAIAVDDVLAAQGTQRQEVKLDARKTFNTFLEICTNGVEDLFLVADQIHFVDGDDHAANTEQPRNKGVAARLRQDAFSRVDQNQRQLGG